MSVLRCFLVGLGALLATAAAVPAADLDPNAYAGSDRCRECHGDKYASWSETFHATVVRNAKEDPSAILGDFSVPGIGFAKSDVEYTIGEHWNQRYMKKIGDDYFVLPKLWSVQSRSWQDYNVWSWRKLPYGKYCKGCHVTAYDPLGNVIAAEDRVGCEACHGPAWAHAESGGEAAVVNPRKLPAERRDMICAACHVRGQDTSGVYAFPVGFVPGEDLGRYYVPKDKGAEESNTAAVLRLFGEWRDRRASKSQVKCDVCGIYGAPGTDEKKPTGAMDFCFKCHQFKDDYAAHTHHPDAAGVVCFDCHVQQEKAISGNPDPDIHTRDYFLLHADACYDRRIERACSKCHGDRPADWARKTVQLWGEPFQLDH